METMVRSNLIKARKEKGYTQQQLADEIGISRAFLANVERGKHSPSLKVAHKIASFLGLRVEDIFFNADVRKTNGTKFA